MKSLFKSLIEKLDRRSRGIYVIKLLFMIPLFLASIFMITHNFITHLVLIYVASFFMINILVMMFIKYDDSYKNRSHQKLYKTYLHNSWIPILNFSLFIIILYNSIEVIIYKIFNYEYGLGDSHYNLIKNLFSND